MSANKLSGAAVRCDDCGKMVEPFRDAQIMQRIRVGGIEYYWRCFPCLHGTEQSA